MLKHEEKYCPRCKNSFECKVGSILLCQCSTVSLNEKEREFMKNNFEDCLCAECMKAVKVEFRNQELKDKMRSILGGAMKFNN